MERYRWLNSAQPQTLYIAVLLFYVNAAFALLGGAVGAPILLAIAAAQVASGFGIANERKWGYFLAVAVAVLPLALYVVSVVGIVHWTVAVSLIGLMFQVALVALLLHPQSREYQRIWFK